MDLRDRPHSSRRQTILHLTLKQFNCVLLAVLVLAFQQFASGASLPSQDSKYSKGSQDDFLHAVFPSDFKWGVGSSAFQVEGGYQDDGKGESIWDKFTQNNPDKIADHSNASISSDSYHKYEEDVRLIKSLGAKTYRFSISWSRVLPKGTTEIVNKAGLAYYNNLIDALLVQGIEPIVCLFHWDLPQNVQNSGGWLNHETIGIFGEYARLMFQTYGDRVKIWITINEIFTFCYYGYDSGIFAPGDRSDPSTHPYACVHSLIMGHALAYRIYKEEFSAQQGRVGISLDNFWQEPANPALEEDRKAAQQSYAFRFDWIAYPLFHGQYPPIMRQIIDAKSKREGRSTSRLPVFDKEWTSRVNGSLDFLGINHFTTQVVRFSPVNSTNDSNWEADSGTIRSYDPNWPGTGSLWLKVFPEGIRSSLNQIRHDYNNPEVIITENGVSTSIDAEHALSSSDLDDYQRIEYHRLYLNQVLKAIHLDGCNITGYVVWSLLDGFEWSAGYTAKFGIYHVDHQNPNRTRTPKKSVKALQKIFKDNGFPPSWIKNKANKKGSISVVSVPASMSNFSPDKLPGSTLIVYSAPFAVVLSAYYAYSHVFRVVV